MPIEQEKRVFKSIHKKQVCRFWLKGTCGKGDACEWLHVMDPEAMPPCSYDPHCTREGCMYKHGVQLIKNPCANYQAGFCSFGNLCKDSHTLSEHIPEISQVFLKHDPCKLLVQERYKTQKSFRKAPCPYFKSDGWCPYFYACAFSHDTQLK
jgi:hypothetical protein